MEKAVFAAEALESVVSMRSDVEIDRVRTRCATLSREADGMVRDTFAAMNQSRSTPLSREQTRTLTRAVLGVFDAINAGMERLPQDAALATMLRRTIEQLRLAVSGLREPSDKIGILHPCAHIRALKREADAMMHRVPSLDASQTAMMSGIAHCVEAAEALESAFGVSPRR